ncbi:MAG TPA: DUF6077 domain-containing protein [Pirellulales bacterium]|nr:DUF6077 domain-containing protein [Pirellulales bacterium]
MLVDLLLPFAVALALFVLPGYAWAAWLHRDDRFAWPLRLTLGFVWSFALFSLLSGPFLWFGGTFGGFLAAVYVCWPVYGLMSGWLWIKARGTASSPASVDTAVDHAEPGDERPPNGPAWVAYGMAAVYGLAAVCCLSLWSAGQSEVQERIVCFSPLLIAWGWIAALLLRRRLAPLLRFTADDEKPAPALWTIVAVLLIGCQAVASEILFRPDWDDCFNLAAVRDYQEAPFLNARNPISRDPGAVNATHRVLGLELWGSVLCHVTDADPQTLFHTLLPGLLVLACYGCYAALLGEVVPRRWVPVSLVGLSAYFVFGICGPYGGANHFLIRVWQGKSLVAHLALPLMAAMLLRFARRRDFASWATLVAAVCAGLGFSSSAIFLGPAAIGCLALALLPSVCGGHRPGVGQAVRFLAAAAAACLPLALEGGAILWSMRRGEQVGHSGAPTAAVSATGHSVHVWFSILNDSSTSRGCSDLLWLFGLPWLGLLLIECRRRAYPVFYPILLVLTAANPVFCFPVATYLTSKDAYYRLFWLLPIGPGLGLLFALLGRLTTKLATTASPRSSLHFPLVAALASGILLAALPGVFVWGPENHNGPFMAPGVGQNLQKMPPDLRIIVERLESDPNVAEHPILSGEEVASFLTPSSSRFSYVLTRLFYLPGFGKDPEDRAATERYFLLQAAYAGPYAEDLRKWRYLVGESAALSPEMLHNADRLPPLRQADRLPRLADLPELVERYRVDYIITSPPLWLDGSGGEGPRQELIASRAELLSRLGYREIYQGRDYSLWQR